MRRPWTWLLLLAFLTAQIYGLRHVVARHTAAPRITKLTAMASGLLTRDGHQYLVGASQVFKLSGAAAHIRLTAVSASWEDVPEPSGAGMWRILATRSGEVLMGLHALVYGSPVSGQAILVDPGTRMPLVTESLSRPPQMLADYTVDRVVWSSLKPLAVFLGQGPHGTGFYSVSKTGAVSFLYSATPRTIATFGDDGEGLSAVTTSGALVYRGEILQGMPEAPAWTFADGSILGWSKNEAMWWQDGNLAGTVAAPLPDARPAVLAGHLTAAYLVGRGTHERLVILTPKKVRTMPFPYADARVVGWYHQSVLITVTSGPHVGTYRVLATATDHLGKKYPGARV